MEFLGALESQDLISWILRLLTCAISRFGFLDIPENGLYFIYGLVQTSRDVFRHPLINIYSSVAETGGSAKKRYKGGLSVSFLCASLPGNLLAGQLGLIFLLLTITACRERIYTEYRRSSRTAPKPSSKRVDSSTEHSGFLLSDVGVYPDNYRFAVNHYRCLLIAVRTGYHQSFTAC